MARRLGFSRAAPRWSCARLLHARRRCHLYSAKQTIPTLGGILPSCGRVHFLVDSWSNNCYLVFQTGVLVAIPAGQFQVVTNRWCTVTAEASLEFDELAQE
jgi:hypothetical protein